MPEKRLLWIDDQISIFTGLQAYLDGVEGLRVLTYESFSDAEKRLREGNIELLLFDLILMSDGNHASLVRGKGVQLVGVALDAGVRNFIAYSVLERNEILREWKEAVERIEEDVQFERFEKAGASVMDVVNEVRRMLSI